MTDPWARPLLGLDKAFHNAIIVIERIDRTPESRVGFVVFFTTSYSMVVLLFLMRTSVSADAISGTCPLTLMEGVARSLPESNERDLTLLPWFWVENCAGSCIG